MPRLDNKLASQTRRKVTWRKGAVMPSAVKIWELSGSVISAPGFA
ncbi:hypothetical protein ACVIWU_006550 [Bradyrhizobium sp. USDA 4509]